MAHFLIHKIRDKSLLFTWFMRSKESKEVSCVRDCNSWQWEGKNTTDDKSGNSEDCIFLVDPSAGYPVCSGLEGLERLSTRTKNTVEAFLYKVDHIVLGR